MSVVQVYATAYSSIPHLSDLSDVLGAGCREKMPDLSDLTGLYWDFIVVYQELGKIKIMSDSWKTAEDGVHEYQHETKPKPDGTYTIAVRQIGQSTRYPHTNFDYNPETGDITFNHHSFSKKKKCGMQEVVRIAIAYLKENNLL